MDKVYLDYGKPSQRPVDRMTIGQATKYLEEGQFPQGSMGPKVKACINFIAGGGREALITSPSKLAEGLRGRAGTFIVPD